MTESLQRTALKKKRKGTYFTQQEELCLLNIIEKYKTIIDNKNSDKLTNIEKDNAWSKICQEFNSKIPHEHRKVEQIKSKFDNLKTKLKKKILLVKKGEEPPTNLQRDAVLEAMLRIISVKSVLKLIYNNDNESYPSDIESYLVASGQRPRCQNSSYLSPILNTDSIKVEAEDEVSQEYKYSQESEFLEVTEHPPEYPTSIESEEVNMKNEVILNNVEESNPSTSTSVDFVSSNTVHRKDHKRTISRKFKARGKNRLRSVSNVNRLADVKKMYYKRKLQLLDKTLRQEFEFRKRKEERDIEEHESKMKLLALDISLREQQLHSKYNGSNSVGQFS